MHGSLLHGFKKFVIARAGEDAWSELCRSAGVSGWYVTNQVYPDQEFKGLVELASRVWRQPVAKVLEEFGEALVPTLLSLYGAFLEPNWRTVDVLSNAEQVIHRTIRMRDPAATPPLLRVLRVDENRVQIEYSSSRRLCALAVGICRGLAANFREQVSIVQSDCMERGDPSCRLLVRVGPEQASVE